MLFPGIAALLSSNVLAFDFDPEWAEKEVGATFRHGNNLASLVLLTEAAQAGAKCLDGSPGAYYVRPGSGDGANKWYIHHEGGGWCTDLDSCLERSKTDLGSSTEYGPTMDPGGGYFSQDPNANPLMHNWNVAYLKYCDGGSFSGLRDSTTMHGGQELHFRGKAVLGATQQSLLQRGLASATDVVISGCSAGGLAAFLHVDAWAALLEPLGTRVVGMPDSGFFLDYQAKEGDGHTSDCEGHYHAGMRWVFEYMNSSSGVNDRCIEAQTSSGQSWKCIFAEHTAPHIVTPTFPLQGAYDSWQLGCDLQSQDQEIVNVWGANLTSLIENNFLAKNKKHGIFLDSCNHHCGGWGQYYVDGKSQPLAFQEWYEKGSQALPNNGYYTQAQAFPCVDCCSPSHDGENIWRQSTNPVTAREGVQGYVAVNVSYQQDFGGLEYEGNDALLDGNVGLDTWWYAAGSFAQFGNGIPGPTIGGANTVQHVVELSVFDEAGSDWVLMLRQTDGQFFAKDEFAKNKGRPESAVYSALDQLEQYRGADGSFLFKMRWPKSTSEVIV